MRIRVNDGEWREATREEEWGCRAVPDASLPAGFSHLLANQADSYFVLVDILALLKKWDGEETRAGATNEKTEPV